MDLKTCSDECGLGSKNVEQEMARLNELAQKDDPAAMRALGLILLDGFDARGRETEHDIRRGIKLLTDASKLGDVTAMTALGMCYMAGTDGLRQDLKRARQLFETACGHDFPEAKYCLAKLMLGDDEKKRDNKKIFALTEDAAGAGIIEAVLNLARFYFRGWGVRRSVKKAIALLLELDAEDIPEAAYRLGRIYDCAGSHHSAKKAVFYLNKACAGGFSAAFYDLAEHYETGYGVKQDPRQALSLYRRYRESRPDDAAGNFRVAALLLLSSYHFDEAYKGEGADCLKKATEGHYPYGLFVTGLGYLYGDFGLKKNEAKAREFILKAGEAGLPQALLETGRMHLSGGLFAKDPVKAAEYFRRAAELKDVDAAYELGCLYRDGNGVAQDKAAALKYFKQAAERGSVPGTFESGRILSESGDEQDRSAGIEMLKKAAKAGQPEAMGALVHLFSVMDRAVTAEELDLSDYYLHCYAAISMAIMYSEGGRSRPGVSTMAPERAFLVLKKAVDEYDFDGSDDRTFIFCGLGHCYERGIGCRANLKTAKLLYETGMRLKDPSAVICLSQLYREGKGVKQDRAKADELRTAAFALMGKEVPVRGKKEGQKPQAKRAGHNAKNDTASLADFIIRSDTLQ